jgi:IS30 family transposase
VAAPQRKKRGGGRPRAFDDAKRKRAVELAKKGLSLNGIAKILRVNRSTLDAELKRNQGFADDMLAADGRGELWCLEKWRRCMDGKGSASQLNAIVKFMARKWPEDWSLARKVEVDAPVTVNIQNNQAIGLEVQEARKQLLNDPDYLEYRRSQLTTGDGDASTVCLDDQRGQVANSAPPGAS